MTEEIKRIQSLFNEVLAYSQTGIVEPQTDELFERWLEAKRGFIEAFGGKLIVEYPKTVTFELEPEEKQERIDDFVHMMYNKYMNRELGEFIVKNREGFFDNKVIYDSTELKIPKGMKLVKAFKFFEQDKEVLAEIQAAASLIIQENKFEGKICLSVHPLDFLSASENNHNWRSCHALNGDYRSGNLSYMVDSSTVMCYMKTKDDEILPNFPETVPWNSKKWRVWLYFSKDWDLMFAGRQYPFSSQSGMNLIKDSILPKYHLGKWGEWIDASVRTITDSKSGLKLRTRDEYLFIGGFLVPKQDVIINEPGSLQFNDLTSSSTYVPMYAQKRVPYEYIPVGWANGKSHVRIGGKVKCCRCGQEHIELSGSMMCMPCELTYGDCEDDSIEICPCCGDRYYYDDGVYIESEDITICPDCANNNYRVCDYCGELVHEDNMVNDEHETRNICYECYNYFKENENGEGYDW